MQRIIFVVFFLIYIISMVGNVLILVTITASPLLETPCTSSWPISPLLMPAIPL
ncbi:Olfactory Receptor 4C13 [Manis pentadactyla]|nr:Olfactory Receptor 4C13 [Manis pentadactyla]KAI5277172.1 Olfactory Receptor 4C13 [Manis pentadactyla]